MLFKVFLFLLNIGGGLATTNWCSDSPMQMCRMGCSSPNCGSNECAYRDGTCCNYYCKSLYPECKCLLGYRNGAQSSDNDLCMGPSERGRRPCYPRPCNADWTACVSEVRTTTTTTTTTPSPQPSPSPEADVECDRWVNKTRWINQTRRVDKIRWEDKINWTQKVNWTQKINWIDRVRWEDKINWTQKINWTDKINWTQKVNWTDKINWTQKVNWTDKTNWTQKVNWTDKINWTQKVNLIDRVRWTNKTNYSNVNVTHVNNVTLMRVKNVTVIIIEYQNKSYQCLNETIIYLNSSYFNNSFYSRLNYNYSRDFDFTSYNKNISNNISFQISQDVLSADVSINANKSNCKDTSDDLSLRELLIIFGFSFVVLCFIIYNIADFFELEGDDCRCLCCKKKKKENQHPMDRNFADMFEMAAFDDDGNFMFGKKNVAIQTENTGAIDSHERKSVDV